ncbi:TetR/AcrR family transcriptional regulator [Sneathiella limimaris]|uniref:TetR/AcrR family transcriptional regulator n=1 Tax=Sneathiella limimaris TaxID=1964213 RepID=UPI00146AC5CB|nr:TetR/AcrR family transcriptional regulator [Sneathiella limimaris]
MTPRRKNTRNALIETATELFSSRGFNGVSIQDVAVELGITKQALLHHFEKKEKLFAEVLERLADRLMKIVTEFEASEEVAADRFQQLHDQLNAYFVDNPQDGRLIARVVLDTSQQPGEKRKWYLKPFLEKLTDIIALDSQCKDMERLEVFALVYQMVSKILFFSISTDTLSGMYGDTDFHEIQDHYQSHLLG